MTKRILSVDLRDKRTGLAVSDEMCVLASGIGCIKEDYIVYIADAVAKKLPNTMFVRLWSVIPSI